MTNGTTFNWWLLGTGLLNFIWCILWNTRSPEDLRHTGTVGGVMVLARLMPFGLTLAACSTVYSLATRTITPVLGIVMSGVLFPISNVVMFLSSVFILAPFPSHGAYFDVIVAFEAFALVAASFLWNRRSKPMKRQQPPAAYRR